MIEVRKPVTRKTAVYVRDGGKPRALVVTLHAEYITLRLHGTRREETVGLEGAYHAAIKGRLFREKMERAKTRKSRAEANKPRGRR